MLLVLLLWSPFSDRRRGLGPASPSKFGASAGAPAHAPPALAGQGEPVEYHGDDPVVVRGVVVSAWDGRRLPGAEVGFDTSAGTFGTRTGADGAFRITVPAVRTRFEGSGFTYRPSWTVRARAEGHLPRTLLLPAEEARVPVRVALSPVAARLSGIVLGPDGAPIPGARIRLEDAKGTAVRSDADGAFGPLSLPVGRVRIGARAPGLAPATLVLFVDPAAEPREIRRAIRLGGAAIARGRVVDREGRPVAGARLTGKNGPDLLATTDSEGRFAVALAPGTREKVRVEAHGYTFPDRYVELAEGKEITVVVWPEAFLEGTVLEADGTPAPGVGLQACHEKGGWVVTASADGEGRFRLGPFRPGRIWIRFYRGGIPLGPVFGVRVPGPGLTGGVELRLPPRIELPCTVTDAETGRALEDVSVLLRPDEEASPLTVSDSGGGFTLSLAPDEGSATVFLAKPGYVTRMIRAGPATRRFALYRAGRFRLRAVDASGQPIPYAYVSLDSLEGGGLPWLRVRAGERFDRGDVLVGPSTSPSVVRVTDEEGKPIPGAWALARGRVYRADDEGYVAVPWHVVTISAPGRERRSVRVGSEDVRLRPGGEISGRVVDEEGRPVSGAAVRGEGLPEHRTDGDGRFRISGAPAGRVVKLEVRHPEWGAWENHAFAVAGAEDVRVTLPRPARLRIQIPDPPEGGLPDRPEMSGVDGSVFDPGRGASLVFFGYEQPTDGEYLFSIPAGRLRIRFGLDRRTVRCYAEREVHAGEEVELIWTDGPPGAVSGTVRGEDGRPVDHADIRVAGRTETIATTDESGRIVEKSWAHPGVGVTRLVVVHPDWGTLRTEPVDLGKHPDLQLVLPRGSAVAGRVVDGQDPVEGAEVRLVGGPEDRERRFVRTGPDGRFALAGRSAPGRARLEVRVPGHLPFYREIDLRSGEDADVEVSLPR